MLKTKKVVLALFLSLAVIQINAASRKRSSSESSAIELLGSRGYVVKTKEEDAFAAGKQAGVAEVLGLLKVTAQAPSLPSVPATSLLSGVSGAVTGAGASVWDSLTKPRGQLCGQDVTAVRVIGATVGGAVALFYSGNKGWLGKPGVKAKEVVKGLLPTKKS